MADLSWIAQEAKTLHALFTSIFYSLALSLLLIGVVTEYFKLPIGGMPQFAHLAGRFLVAAILLSSYSEISNLIADFTDSLANQIGSLNNIKLVLGKYYEKIQQFQLSWTSIKDSLLMLVTFVVFFILYISVYIADAAITYAWVLLYVFSPLLIALYVLPATAGATKALYRSLIEVGAWKIVWSVLATLLWSSALSQINDPHNNVNFITALSLNLILAASLLLTPLVVNALAGAGIATLASQTAGLAAGSAMFSPGRLLTKQMGGKVGSSGGGSSPGGGSPTTSNKFFKETSSSSKPKAQQGTVSGQKSASAGPSQTSHSSQPKVVTTKSKPQTNTSSTSFKSAVARYKPPKNNSEYKKQPIQSSLFSESRKLNGERK